MLRPIVVAQVPGQVEWSDYLQEQKMVHILSDASGSLDCTVDRDTRWIQWPWNRYVQECGWFGAKSEGVIECAATMTTSLWQHVSG